MLGPKESTGAEDVQKLGWRQFLAQLEELNRGGTAKYKLFFVVRHGEGDHNVKEAEVGRMEWEVRISSLEIVEPVTNPLFQRHWARLNGDGKMTWFDAHLTEEGKRQALAIAEFLEVSAAQTKMPLPRRRYTSPLARCLETTRLAFSGASAAEEDSKTIIKEGLRERLGVHTCDKRRTRSWIRENYPAFEIEDGFAEDDVLWKADTRESAEEHVLRINKLLQDIFEDDEEMVISLTAHSGAIRALYSAIGHREVWVGAGAMVPVLIKAQPET